MIQVKNVYDSAMVLNFPTRVWYICQLKEYLNEVGKGTPICECDC